APAEAEAWRVEQRRQQRNGAQRKTPVYPSELRRLERQRQARRRRKRARPHGEHYTTDSYRRTIAYAIKKANRAGVAVPAWFPHQLRHSKGTEVRKRYGLEGAQLALGHAKVDITQLYAERDLHKAMRIARKTG
ncbi:MAG: tyrosine-type recombinase/integrase, partial [Chloroflexota bacterium]|nr:tyrosine-type recombinase/integrase [Chloroflexota bacterium]